MGHPARLYGGFHLVQLAFGNTDIDPIFGAFDLRQDLGLTGLQFGALDVVLGLHQVHRVHLVIDGVARLRLNDFAIGGTDGRALLDEVLFLLNGVKLDDDLAFLMAFPDSASLTMRGSGTWGAVNETDRVLRISPRVRTLMMKSPFRTRATGTSTSVVPV